MNRIAVLVCLLTVSVTSAQWLEKTARLPDSLGGVENPRAFCVNTGNNTVFVGGSGDRVVVLDGVTNHRVAAVMVPGGAERMCYNPARNKVYGINRSRPYAYVIDAASNVLEDSVYVGPDLSDICFVPTVNKVYCSSESDRTVTAIDCSADTVTGRAEVWGYYELRLCPAPGANKVYCSFYDPSRENMAVLDCASDTVVDSVRFVDVRADDIAYNPVANKLYVSWGSFGEVIIVDCATDSVLTWVSIGEGYGRLAVDTTDNKVYVSCHDAGQIDVISGVTNSVTTVIPTSQPAALAWDAAGNILLCVDRDRSGLVAFDCRADTVLGFVSTGSADSLCWNPVQGRALLSVGNEVVVVEPSPPEVAARVPMWVDIGALCWNPDDDLLYAAGASVAVIELPANRVRGYINVPTKPTDFVYNPARRKLYCACDMSVAVIDCAGDSLLKVIATVPGMERLCYNPVNDKVYAAGYYGPAVIDCAGDSLLTPGLFSDISAMAYSPQSNRLFCALYGGEVGIVDGRSDSVLGYVQVSTDDHDLCYIPDGDLLACSNEGHLTVDLIDCASGWVYSEAQLYYEPYRLGYSRRSRKLYSFEQTGGHVTVLDVPVMRAVGELWLTGDVISLDYDSLSDRLACGLSQSVPAVRFIDCVRDSFVAHIPVPGRPVSMVLGAGRRLYTANRDSSSYSVIRDTSLVGVEDGHKPQAADFKLEPTIVRAVLSIGDRGPKTGDRAELLDISGRKVLSLRAGANDVRNLSPGIYFVREVSESVGTTRKVVITR